MHRNTALRRAVVALLTPAVHAVPEFVDVPVTNSGALPNQVEETPISVNVFTQAETVEDEATPSVPPVRKLLTQLIVQLEYGTPEDATDPILDQMDRLRDVVERAMPTLLPDIGRVIYTGSITELEDNETMGQVMAFTQLYYRVEGWYQPANSRVEDVAPLNRVTHRVYLPDNDDTPETIYLEREP
jgi:hypothetical protein